MRGGQWTKYARSLFVPKGTAGPIIAGLNTAAAAALANPKASNSRGEASSQGAPFQLTKRRDFNYAATLTFRRRRTPSICAIRSYAGDVTGCHHRFGEAAEAWRKARRDTY
jgi:hypothetical protein